MREIQFYKTSSGHSPVEEFLDSLSDSQAKKVTWVLRLVERLPAVPIQYFKKLIGTEDIWEVRIQYGGDIFRLLGFFEKENIIILTNGFAKKSQRIPEQEIVIAERRKNEYLKRKK